MSLYRFYSLSLQSVSLQIVVYCEFAQLDFSVVEFKLECTDWCVMGLAEQYNDIIFSEGVTGIQYMTYQWYIL